MKKKKLKMYPDKTIPMKFHDPVSPMPMCGEGYIGFQEWLIKKEKKHHEIVQQYKERNFDSMMNEGEDYPSHRIYTKPTPIDLER